MPATRARGSSAELRPRIRVQCGDDIALGPGKADLLGQIDKTRSLNQSAKAMGMSYMRAWLLVQMMNRCFRKPLVKLSRGGAGGGSAELTPDGKSVLALYLEMHSASLKAMRPAWTALRRRLKS